MSLATHLQLGRVSNLPTVWSNVLAAAVLASGTALPPGPLLLLLAGFSALYIGGMYLNDACDAAIDARERPERPIPSGRITRAAVLRWALAWFAAGVAGIGVAHAVSSPSADGAWWVPTLALLGCIVAYDLHHKGNRFGPALMAGCRALVYLGTALALVGEAPLPLLVGAVLVFCWIAGLTAFAKREGTPDIDRPGAPAGWPWPLIVLLLPAFYALGSGRNIALVVSLSIALMLLVGLARHWMQRRRGQDFPAAIGVLIAGVSLVDALAIATTGEARLALLACACGVLTLLLQRRIAGT